MKKSIIITIIALALLVYIVNAYPVVDYHQFYGDVTGVSPGTTVKAELDNVTFTTVVDSNGRYGYSPFFYVHGTTNGHTIKFYLKNRQITTRAFEAGEITELDLEYETTTPTPSPRPSTGGGGGGGGGWRATAWYRNQTIPQAAPEIPEGAGDCFDDWICGMWSRCLKPEEVEIPEITPGPGMGIQTRTCSMNDYPNCTLALPKPNEQQECELPLPPPPPPPSCTDGIKNQDETFADCGGTICKACDPRLTCNLDRDCVTNYCNPSTRTCDWKPEPVQIPLPPPPEPSYWWIWVLVGAFVLVGAGLGFLMYIETRKREEYPAEEEALPQRLKDLKKYVDTFTKKGVSKEKIFTKLKDSGWKDRDIKKVMGEVSVKKTDRLAELEKYAKTFEEKGVPKEKIAAKLEEAGWKPDDIRKVL